MFFKRHGLLLLIPLLFIFISIPFSLAAQQDSTISSKKEADTTNPMDLVEQEGISFKETKRTYTEEKFEGLRKRYSRLKGVVMVGITNEKGEVLLRGPENWTPPGGPVKKGEDWKSAASNIMKKQTGFAIHIDEPVLLEQMHFYQKEKSDAHFSTFLLHFRASFEAEKVSVPDEFQWFNRVPGDAHSNHVSHIKLYLQ